MTNRRQQDLLRKLTEKTIPKDELSKNKSVKKQDEPLFLKQVFDASTNRQVKGLFKQQADFVNDPSIKKVAFCSRRAGKSWAACALLAKTALTNTYVSCLYMSISREKSTELVWNDLQNFNEQWSLGFEFNQLHLTVYHPVTRSRIYFRGYETSKERSKALGGGYSLVIIDEAQLLGRDLEGFINDELIPTTFTSGKEGTICLLGTPNTTPIGLFYEITSGESTKGWSVHSWVMKDNPYIKNVQERQQKILDDNGWTVDNPNFQRQYLGKWVTSSDTLAFKFDFKRNLTTEIPENLKYSMGIDIGRNDPTAIVICGTTENDHNFYVVDAFLKADIIGTEIADIIEKYRKQYQISAIIMDPGGGGSMVAGEYTKRYGFPIRTPEVNKNRRVGIDFLNDDLFTGKLKILDSNNETLKSLIDELCTIQWKDPVKYQFRAKSVDHLADALRYAHGVSFHYRKKNAINYNHIEEKSDDEIKQELLNKYCNQQIGKKMSWQKRNLIDLRS